MAISRVKTWIAGEILTASDLNAEFNNIINNALSLISPLTANLDFDNFSAIDFRFERFTATQTAANESRAYWHTVEDTLHIDDGTNIRRVPAVTNLASGTLIIAASATTFGVLAPGAINQVLTMTTAATAAWAAAAGGGGNPIQSAMFN